MKARSLFALAALTLLAGPVAPARAQDGVPTPLAIGAAIPMADAKLQNVDGKDVTIAGVKGAKGTLVVFTCNACPFAKKWETRVTRIGNAAMGRGIGVIAINSNDPGRNPEDGFDVMQARAKQRGMKFAYAVDGTSQVAGAFGANHTPEVFLFDAAGKLVYHGAVDDNADDAKAVKNAYLENAIASVASGKKVAMAQTKAIGCSIKYRGKSAS